MRIAHTVCALVLGLAPLALGCAGPGEGSLGEGDGPGLREAEIKPGAGGNNGLDSGYYQDNEAPLAAATGLRLTKPGTSQVSALVLATGILATEGGRAVFKYAIKCALPNGQQVTSGGMVFTGKGYLASTAGWTTGPIGAAARDELLACMIAHVNSTQGVDILLSGQQVTDDGGDHSDFDVDEALWLVKPHITGGFEYHVWPTIPFATACGADPWEALAERICGQDPEGCQFIGRHDLATACVIDPVKGGYVCDGKPALKTTLKSADVFVLHPSCIAGN